MAIKTSIHTFVVSICTVAILLGCTGNSKETAFAEMFPIKEMNTKIRFWPQSHDDREFIPCGFNDLTLENFSDYKIIFPQDYGLKIYFYDQKERTWLEIQNSVKYLPEGNRQLSPKGSDNPLGVTGVDFVPSVPDCEKPIDVRVVIVGEMYQNDTPLEIPVGAYVDITLRP